MSSLDEELPGDSTIVDPNLFISSTTGVGPPPQEGWEEKTHDQGRPPIPPLGPPTDEALVTPIPPTPLLAALPLIGSPGRFVVTEGTDRGREFSLGARQTRVGRGADNNVVLTDISVSRHHVVVHFDGSHYIVEDLGSGNGTLVNGVSAEGRVALRNGDQIELGTTILRFHQTDATPAPRPQPPRIPTDAPVRKSQGVPLPLFPLNAAGPSQDEASGRFPSAFPFAELGNRVEAPILMVPVGTAEHERARRRIWMLVAAGATALALTMGGVALWRAGRRSPAVAVGPTVTKTIPVPILTPLPAPIVTQLPAAAPVPVPAPEPERLPPNAIASAGPFVPAAAVTRAVMEPPPPPEGPKPPPPAPKPVAVAPKPAPPPPKPAPPPKVVAKAEKPAPKAAPAPKPQPPPKVIAAAPTKQAPRRPTAVTPKTVTVAAAPAPLKPAQASRQAASLYAAKRFDEASATLARATEADPNLRAVARDYAAVGAGLARGDASAQSNPMAAMAAYSDALRADQRSGKGQHQKTLRAKLAQVAPRAAVAFLDAGRLESARASADLAAANGSANDPNVKAVRVGLEAKARELFNRGQELSRSQPEAARTLWRRVMKIVPDESPWYEKADAALSKAGMSDGIDL